MKITMHLRKPMHSLLKPPTPLHTGFLKIDKESIIKIAQSCGATGKEFARYWVHNGFVQVNQEKMSKSLGNFFTIREIFEKSEWSEEVTGEILR
jgi:hypothetical protein